MRWFGLFLALALGTAQAQINLGHGGAWFNPQTAGQGILVEVIESGSTLFIAWFTYEASAGKIGAEDHRWLTGQGEYVDARAEIQLFNTRGGLFDEASAVTTDPVGTAVLEFIDCQNATFSYELDNGSLSGSFELVRISDGAICDGL